VGFTELAFPARSQQRRSNIMAILGLLLLFAAGGLTLDVVLQNTSSINIDAVGQTFTISTGGLFLAAVITGAVGLLGVTMLLAGVARARRRRLAVAESRGASHDLQTDRDRLAAELDLERAGHTSTPLAPSQPATMASSTAGTESPPTRRISL